MQSEREGRGGSGGFFFSSSSSLWNFKSLCQISEQGGTCLICGKKKKGGEGSDITQEGDERLSTQTRTCRVRAFKDKGQRSTAASRGDDKKAEITDVRDLGNLFEEPSKTFRSAKYLCCRILARGIRQCGPAEARFSTPDVIGQTTNRDPSCFPSRSFFPSLCSRVPLSLGGATSVNNICNSPSALTSCLGNRCSC